MNRRIPHIHPIKVGSIVVSPMPHYNITRDKKYVVEGTYEGHIILRDDEGELRSYNTYQFIEADLYFTMCLFSTLITLFKLGSKAYK